MTYRLLDLFCCGGGIARGYREAGFDVVGVDIADQPDYPYEFVKADALGVLDALVAGVGAYRSRVWLDGLGAFDAIHASPPCQTYTRAKHLRAAQGGTGDGVDLIEPTRARLRRLGVPYVIENVPGAPLHGYTLCGSMFGLAVKRHRVFESNVYVEPPACDHKSFPVDARSGKPRPIGVYHVLGDEVPKGGKTAETLEQAQAAMGLALPWDRLKEAIPPAYGVLIGEALLAAIR